MELEEMKNTWNLLNRRLDEDKTPERIPDSGDDTEKSR